VTDAVTLISESVQHCRVVVDALLSLPRWVYLGVAAGAVLSCCVAATFLVGTRRFPDGDAARARSDRSTEAIRRAEIRRYLAAIDERFAEDAEVAGNRVAFFLPERDVAVTFDARTFLALEATPTHAVLAEHEMPGAALGTRLPFDTPAPSGSRPDPESIPAGRGEPAAPEAAYEELGLPRGADEAAVRRAYRRRVKQVHPDHGGDEREFRRLQAAYDAARRDAT
jgi:DnaJ-domain-containing protein 1